MDSKELWLLDELVIVKNSFSLAISQIPADASRIVAFGTWDIRAIVAHLIEWDRASGADIKAFKANSIPGWVENIDTFNEDARKRWERASWKKIVCSFVKHSIGIISEYKRVPDNEKFISLWPNHEMSTARMVNIDVDHHQKHLDEILQYFRKSGYEINI